MTRTALYLRISQDRDGTMLGVERQEQDCHTLATQRGWTVEHVLVDDDISAYKGKRRPAYEQLLALIAEGEVQAVVAWHPDRLHRSPVELERFIDLVQQTGCEVATVRAGDLDLSTAAGRMTARVVGAVARHESEQKSERLRRQREQAALAGHPHGGSRPFGWQPDRLSLDPDESREIRWAAGQVLAGRSIRSIAAEWNRRGVKAVKGGDWWPSNVRHLLCNPRLAGLRTHHGEIVGEGRWEPILTRAEHEQIVGALTVVRRGRKPSSLLGGLIVCGPCGSRLTHDTPRRFGRRYVCTDNPGKQACGRVSIAATPVETAVCGAVLAAAGRLRLTIAGPDTPDLIGPLEQERKVLSEMLGAGEMTRGEYLTARKVLEERLARARRKQIRDENRKALVDAGSLLDRWDTLGVEERRRVLGVFIDRIVVRPHQTGDRPGDRIDVIWAI